MRKIVVANWKMNKTIEESELFAITINSKIKVISNEVFVAICPSSVYLKTLRDKLDPRIKVGAQNCSEFENGAYTGEISASMLQSINVEYCIVGHSERRLFYNETSTIVADKISRLIERNIQPIYCCGESAIERDNSKHFKVLEDQLRKEVFHLNSKEIERIVIAYEPVWAIGSGVTASAKQAQEMHQYIRNLIEVKYGAIASKVPIIYGGSCNENNAEELFACQDVNGGLIGGASLEVIPFLKIINSFP